MIVFSLSRIFITPESVKVIQRILSGLVSVFFRIYETFSDKSWVFPVPGPASTKSGPSKYSTASFCLAFKPI